MNLHSNRVQMGWSPTKLFIMSAIFVVIGSFAITAPRAWELPKLRSTNSSLANKVDAIGELKRRLYMVGDSEELILLSELQSELLTMFPGHPETSDIYTETRAACDLAGVDLRQLSFGLPDESLGPASGGTWIYSAQADLSGSANPVDLANAIDVLRLSGRPTTVRTFSLRRVDQASDIFEFQVRLAFPYRDAPPVEFEDEYEQ